MKQRTKLIVIASVLGVIAIASWLTPYDYSNCTVTPTPGFNCVFRNSGLTIVRTLSLTFFVLVAIRATQDRN